MMVHVRKILLVVFISALIWVWSDEALTRETSVPAAISVDKSTSPELWVNFNLQPICPVQLKLSGPASKIDSVERKLKEGSLRLEFFVNPTEEKLTAGNHSYTLLPLIQNSRTIADLGLQVESVEPATTNIEVVQLVKKTLTVQVLNENRTPVKDPNIVPATFEMPVPQNWAGDKLKAVVTLTQQEIEQARVGGISRKPVIELAPGVPKSADTQVKITLPGKKELLKESSVEAKIGYIFTPNRAGKYRVELINQNLVFEAIKIQSTPEAKDAYESIPFKMLLDIKDDDPVGTELSRAVTFNLPDEFVRKNEISVLEPEQRKAKFKVVPVEPPQSSAATAP